VKRHSQLQWVLIHFSISALTSVPLLGEIFYIYQNRETKLQDLLSGSRLLVVVSLALMVVIMLLSRRALLHAIACRFLGPSLDSKNTEERIQKPPGSYLRALAECLFSSRVFALVLEPILWDLYVEYCEALNEGRLRKAEWVRIRGYWSFWSAVFAQLPISAVKVVYKIWKATR
jgi:hypothetical protein